ncbi:MAG: CPBP family intramembrane glutamic endopeptidase [Amphritea sp.]
MPGKQTASSAKIIRIALLFEGSLVGVALGLGWLFSYPPFAQFLLSWQGGIRGLLATLPPLLVVLIASQLDYLPIKGLFRLSRERVATLFSGASLLDIALISCMAGIGEEALFRGVIQMALVTELTPLTGIVIASLLFGLVHFISLTYALFATLFGLYLGWLLFSFDNLLVPIVTHTVYDFIVLACLVCRRSG